MDVGYAGSARGVEISFRNLAASARAAQQRLGLHADDVWLASLSPAHVGGLALVTRALLLGCRLVAVGPFDAARTLQLIDRGESAVETEGGPVTHVSVVPTQLLRLLELRGATPTPHVPVRPGGGLVPRSDSSSGRIRPVGLWRSPTA